MIPVIEETDLFTRRIYFSTSGAVLALIVCTLLLIDVLHKYHSITKSKCKNASSKKQAYLMIICYFIFTSLASFSYAFVRTNAFTRIQNKQFTNIQCSIGYLMSYLFFYSSMSVLYVIFVWRIHTTLKESAYGYHPYILKALYTFIAIMTILWLFNAIYDSIKAEWRILSHHGVSMCANFVTDYDDYAASLFAAIALMTAIFHFVMNSVLLLMFVKGLWSINKLFIKVYVKEHIHCNSTKDPADTDSDQSDHESSVRTANMNMNIVLDNLQSVQSAKHILLLYDLIKKQTILVSISVISSVALWSLNLENNWFSLQIYWDVALNGICLWLMLGSSQKYWKLCTKTCARCCYLKENAIFSQN